MPEIVDGNVVEQVLTPLAEYIAQKQTELANLQAHIDSMKIKQEQVLAELQALLTQGE